MRAVASLLTVVLALGMRAQSSAPAATAPSLTVSSQLVVLDVTVQDREGHAVHGLKQSDFNIVESRTTEAIKTFDEHISTDPDRNKFPPPLKLPPGTFTDFTPVPEDAALNVLLIDALNTPTRDQSYVRDQLKQFLLQAKPGSRIAIFGLGTRLVMLQGFTSDPEILKTIVERKLIPRVSVLLDDPANANTNSSSFADALNEAGATSAAIADLQQFQASTAAFQAQLRIRYTLDAFNQLARFLQSLPGRKNLLWFSGSFPLNVFPDAALEDPFAVQLNASGELRETATLLDRARVAVYPIDARGLQNSPVFDASRSGSEYVGSTAKMSADVMAFNQANAQEHLSMDQIAEDTGGRAFYNTNGLAAAVTKSIEAGSNFYTLTYAPTKREGKGEYRSIHIQLQGDAASHGYVLSYRHGYVAPDTSGRNAAEPPPPATDPVAAPYSFDRVAMQRGAPTPSEVLFKLNVLPDSTATVDKVAENNQPNPQGYLHGPFRNYDVTFAVLGSTITLKPQGDGHHQGSIEFIAYVYDAEGRLLNAAANSLSLNLNPDDYASLMRSGLGYGLQISAPAHTDTFLRIAVQDVTSGHYGVIEIPTTTVSRLPPPAAVPASPAPPTPAQ